MTATTVADLMTEGMEVGVITTVMTILDAGDISVKQEVVIMDMRAEYVEKLSAQMVEWDAKIDLLKDKAECASPEEKFEYSSSIAAFQFKRDEAAKKLQGISAAGDNEWEELRTGTERVWDELRGIVHDAIIKIK